MRDARRGGFTIVEIAIVAIMLGIMAGIAMPNLTRAIHKADAAKIATDIRSIELGVQSHLEATGSLPASAGWAVLPPDLVPYLPDNMAWSYKHLNYRLRTNTRRGRVRVQVRYPRNDAIGEALKRFRRTGEVNWNRTTTTFILDPQ